MCVVSFRSFIFSFIDYMGCRSAYHLNICVGIVAYVWWVGSYHETTTGMLDMVGPTSQVSSVCSFLFFPPLSHSEIGYIANTTHSTMIITELSKQRNPCT